MARIVGNLVDVAEGDELLEQGLVGVGAGFRACLAGSVRVFPCGQGFDRSPFEEDILEHAPFHILADGQSKVMQHSGCDIEQAGAEDQFVRLEAGPAGGDDALRTVPHRDARRHAGREFGPQVVAVEAVVRDEHHGRIRPSELHEALEEEVVQAVGAIHDIAIHRKVLFGYALHARRVVGHEEVADLIYRPIVNGHEVPLGIGLQKVRGGIVRGEGLGELLSEHPQAFILRLVYLRGIGHKKPDHLVGVDLMRAQAQVIHRLRQLGRPVGAGRRRRPLGGILILLGAAEVAEHIRHHLAIEMLLALSGKPTHDMAAQTALTKHFPQGAALTRGRGDRHHCAGPRVHLGETRHAVVIGHLARGDRGPQHRRELRLERGEVATHAALDQTRHAGQRARIEKRVDDFPISGIPANEEKFFSQEVFCALKEKVALFYDLETA